MKSLKVRVINYQPHLVAIQLNNSGKTMKIPRKVFDWRLDCGFYEVENQECLPKWF